MMIKLIVSETDVMISTISPVTVFLLMLYCLSFITVAFYSLPDCATAEIMSVPNSP